MKKNHSETVKKNVEARCVRLEKIAGRKGLTAEDRTALLESARFMSSWNGIIYRHSHSEQMRNMNLSGAILQIIKLASESLMPYCKQEWIDSWIAFKKGGDK